MARVAPVVPEESALLCEKCGYIINGIATDSLCPECATPIAQSLPTLRQPPIWETEIGSSTARFWRTSVQVIFSPARFYRSITARGERNKSAAFATGHIQLTAILS